MFLLIKHKSRLHMDLFHQLHLDLRGLLIREDMDISQSDWLIYLSIKIISPVIGCYAQSLGSVIFGLEQTWADSSGGGCELIHNFQDVMATRKH